MKTIHTTFDPKEAALVEMALRDAGVDFRLDNANVAVSLSSTAFKVGVLVRDEDAPRATRAIRSALRRMEGPPKRRRTRK
jgi:hypothetical protein